MPSKEENKLIKRNKILEAAYELFSKNGINLTPIDEVVKKAGVAKGTFYLYFKDKYDLTDQIVLHECTQIVKKVIKEVSEAAKRETLTAVDELILFADKIIDSMVENREILTLINSKISGLFQMLISGDDPDIRQNIDSAAGLFKRMGYNDEEAKKNLYVISNMLTVVCCETVLTENPYTIEEIRPVIHNILEKLIPERGVLND